MTSWIEGSYPLRRERVAQLMREKGWSALRLAENAQLNKRTIKRLFEGQSLRISSIESIGRVLGVTSDELIDRPENSKCEKAEAEKKVCLRFSFEVDVPYSPTWEQDHAPGLLAEIGKRIEQIGAIIVESTSPGSVRVVCWATDASDVARFFTLFTEGGLESLRIRNPQILSQEDEPEPNENVTPPRRSSNSAGPTTQISETVAPPQSHVEDNVADDPPDTDSKLLRDIAAGVAAGAAVGSVVPGVGTAVGAFLGGVFASVISRSRKNESKNPKSD